MSIQEVLDPKQLITAEAKSECIRRARDIAGTWYKTVEGVLTTAIKCREAAEAYVGQTELMKEFLDTLQNEGIGRATFHKLKTIAENKKWISGTKTDGYKIIQANIEALPASYNSLHSLTLTYKTNAADYDVYYSELSAGKDFEDININSGKKGSKKKRRERFQTLFSFSVDPTKLDNSDKKELEEFVSSYQRKKSKVRIRVSPLYNKMTTKDED